MTLSCFRIKKPNSADVYDITYICLKSKTELRVRAETELESRFGFFISRHQTSEYIFREKHQLKVKVKRKSNKTRSDLEQNFFTMNFWRCFFRTQRQPSF